MAIHGTPMDRMAGRLHQSPAMMRRYRHQARLWSLKAIPVTTLRAPTEADVRRIVARLIHSTLPAWTRFSLAALPADPKSDVNRMAAAISHMIHQNIRHSDVVVR